MPRRSVLMLAVAVAAVAVVSAAGCGASGEQQILKRFFDANRMRDQSTVATMATVEFDPEEHGTVQSFSVETVSEETRAGLNIKQYASDWRAAQQSQDEFSKRITEYQKANAEEIDRVNRAALQNRPLRGKDAELHASWQKWLADRAEHNNKVLDTRRRLSRETRVAEVSAFDARKPIDVTQYDGELITKQVTINARVMPPDGGAATDNRYVVTMQRAELKGPDGDRNGRWIITGIAPAQ
jgi:hypothetical protein